MNGRRAGRGLRRGSIVPKPSAILLCGVLLSGLIGWLLSDALPPEQAAVSAAKTAELPIIMYHSVTDLGESPGEYVISPSRLEEDLQYLRAQGFHTVTLSALRDFVNEGTPLPEKPILLTFDDGYYNNYANAYPLLRRYGMCAVLSPVGSLTERFTAAQEPPNESWSYCTEDQLSELAQSGVFELAHHSYDFHALAPRRGCLRKAGETEDSYRTAFLDDTQQEQELLARVGAAEPICYTYPYGFYSEESERLIHESGFPISLICEEGINHLMVGDASGLLCMKRYNRDGRQTTEAFWNRIEEAMP